MSPIVIIMSPCCQDAENVHQEPSPHHLSCLEAAGSVADGVRSSGHRQHEGVTHTHLGASVNINMRDLAFNINCCDSLHRSSSGTGG